RAKVAGAASAAGRSSVVVMRSTLCGSGVARLPRRADPAPRGQQSAPRIPGEKVDPWGAGLRGCLGVCLLHAGDVAKERRDVALEERLGAVVRDLAVLDEARRDLDEALGLAHDDRVDVAQHGLEVLLRGRGRDAAGRCADDGDGGTVEREVAVGTAGPLDRV